MVPLPPTIGRYEIVRLVRRGGMGTVFLARDPVIDRSVAIKLLHQSHDAELRERFLREARSVGRLRHPNIVTIFEFGLHDDEPFIAMEWIEGETLDHLIRRNAPLSLSQKLQIMSQLCAGLHHAHQAGIVHRDVKPPNIIIERDGGLKILDFGIARAGAADLTRIGVIVGSPNYMAPEQVIGPAITERTDIFAVGTVFYELLAYRRAFAGEVVEGVIHKVLYEDPASLEVLVPGLPSPLVAIVRRCLQKRPEARYADLASVDEALTDVHAHLNAATHVLSASHIRSSWRARRGLLLKGLVALLALLVVASAWQWARGRFDLTKVTSTAPPAPATTTPTPPDPEKAKKTRAALAEGDYYRGTGEYDKAIQMYREGLQLDPTNAQLRDGLSRAERAKKAELALRP